MSVGKTPEAAQPEVFVHEKYVLQKEILQPVLHYGLGIRLPANKISEAIMQKRVHPNLIVNRDFVVICEEQIDPNQDWRTEREKDIAGV